LRSVFSLSLEFSFSVSVQSVVFSFHLVWGLGLGFSVSGFGFRAEDTKKSSVQCSSYTANGKEGQEGQGKE
jgi:hypothetical protein